MKEKISVIIPCAGKGSRMGYTQNKLFLPLLGKPCLSHTLAVFDGVDDVAEIILCVAEGEEDAIRALCNGVKVPVRFVKGGTTRQESVKNGLLAAHGEWVLVHDGARCLVSQDIILCTIADAKIYGAAACGVRMKDTVKVVDDSGNIVKTVPRENLVRIQTPQVFRKAELLRAYEIAEEDGFTGTDEASLAEHAGVCVHVAEGSEENLKLTTPDDILVAESILKRRLGL